MRPGHAERARRFRALHLGGTILRLGSVWDAASAVVFEREGFAALGTSSAGVAYAHGFADGESISLDRMLSAVGTIASAVGVPVSADLESGFSDEPEAVARACIRAVEAGAVGVNLEDSRPGRAQALTDIEWQCNLIRTVRRAANDAGVPLFINARTDSYWLKLGDAPRCFKDSIERCQAYTAAGADGVFVPGVLDPEEIARLVRGVSAPLNVLASPGSPDIDTLSGLGVRRVSQGSGPARAALGLSRRIARELLDQGRYTLFHEGAIPYAEANRMFGTHCSLMAHESLQKLKE